MVHGEYRSPGRRGTRSVRAAESGRRGDAAVPGVLPGALGRGVHATLPPGGPHVSRPVRQPDLHQRVNDDPVVLFSILGSS